MVETSMLLLTVIAVLLFGSILGISVMVSSVFPMPITSWPKYNTPRNAPPPTIPAISAMQMVFTMVFPKPPDFFLAFGGSA
jgi:hypothetical protein